MHGTGVRGQGCVRHPTFTSTTSLVFRDGFFRHLFRRVLGLILQAIAFLGGDGCRADDLLVAAVGSSVAACCVVCDETWLESSRRHVVVSDGQQRSCPGESIQNAERAVALGRSLICGAAGTLEKAVTSGRFQSTSTGSLDLVRNTPFNTLSLSS